MNIRRIRTQSLAFLLTVSFLIPSGLAIPTKKAEAATNCVAPIAGVMGAALGLIATKEAVGVSTAPGDSKANAVTAGGQYGQFFNDCILKPLAIKMARTMVRNISNSIINWINTGFQGKPGFVTDFKGLVADSADQAIGNFIYGTDLKFLCQPFSVRIRLQLATKYQRQFQDEVRCTLTNITGNVNSFVNNNGGAGWDNWLQITTEPQNNRYGAYLIAESELASRIQDQLDQITKTLDRSNGFLDYKICDEKAPDRETKDEAEARAANALSGYKEYDDQIITKADTDPTPRCKTGGRVVTPGSLVSEQANKVLGGWADQLNLATEIDQIVGALISHFADKMISGAQGFLGLSSPGGYARSNLSVNQALAAGDNLSWPENSGLEQIGLEAGNTITFTESILKESQVIESGVNILEGRSVQTNGPSSVPSSNLEAMTDGNISSVGSVGRAGSGVQSLWVKLDLGESMEVSELHIWHPDVDPAGTVGTFNVVFSNDESARTWVSNEYKVEEGSPNPTIVRVNREGRYITLEKKMTCSEDCQPFMIAEIEAIGPAAVNSGVSSDTSTSTPESSRVTFGPTDGEVTYATSSSMSIAIPIRSSKSIVVKSLDVNLYSGEREIPFNSVMTAAVSLKHLGFTRNLYPGASSGGRFANISLTPTSDTSISILGPINFNAPLGAYKLVLIMRDDIGEILDTRTVNFVVQ